MPFFIAAAAFYILTGNAQGLRILYSLTGACISCFSGIVTVRGVKRYLTVGVICVSLMTRDVKHLCLCLLAICTSSL